MNQHLLATKRPLQQAAATICTAASQIPAC
jgi:hypothetical protein